MTLFVRLRGIVRRFVPGIIAGGADNDPSGITTYSISGAQFGYSQLWIMVLATPMLIAVQAMCARLGYVKRKGLASIIRDHYPPVFVMLVAGLLVIANVITIGADLAGVSAAFGLVTNSPYWWWIVPVSFLIWGGVVFFDFRKIRMILLGLNTVFLAYVVSAILSRPDWSVVVTHLVIPGGTFSPQYFLAAIALLGTTITPYLFFWQAEEEVEEKNKRKETARTEDHLLAPGFIFSNVISIAIMVATATVLYTRGIRDISSALEAAAALEPLAGPMAKYLFAIGIIGSGFLAIPILAASAASAVSELMGWKSSLSDKPYQAKGFYTVITASIITGALMSLVGIDPIRALFYSQALNGMVGPILIIFILLLCTNKKLMGNLVNDWFDTFFGWLAVVVMLLATAGFFWSW